MAVHRPKFYRIRSADPRSIGFPFVLLLDPKNEEEDENEHEDEIRGFGQHPTPESKRGSRVRQGQFPEGFRPRAKRGFRLDFGPGTSDSGLDFVSHE